MNEKETICMSPPMRKDRPASHGGLDRRSLLLNGPILEPIQSDVDMRRKSSSTRAFFSSSSTPKSPRSAAKGTSKRKSISLRNMFSSSKTNTEKVKSQSLRDIFSSPPKDMRKSPLPPIRKSSQRNLTMNHNNIMNSPNKISSFPPPLSPTSSSSKGKTKKSYLTRDKRNIIERVDVDSMLSMASLY